MALGMTKINNTSILTGEEIAANTLEWSSDEGNVINVAAAEQVIDCMLQIQITFVAAGDDAELHLRYSLDDGSTEDTPEVKTYAMTIENPGSTTTQIVSYRVPGGFEYLDIGIKNIDSSEVITSVVIDATYTKLTGLETS